jgi:hypothetical protein
LVARRRRRRTQLCAGARTHHAPRRPRRLHCCTLMKFHGSLHNGLSKKATKTASAWFFSFLLLPTERAVCDWFLTA